MFQVQEIKRLCPLLFFWAGYTVLFLLWVKTFFYTLPFLLGFLIASALQPVIVFFDKNLKWKHNVSTAATTVLALAVLFAGLTFLTIFAAREITAFIVRASEDGFSEFSQPVSDFLNRIGAYLQRFDLSFLEQNKQEIMDLLKSSMDLIVKFLGTVLGIITSLPTVVTMLIVVVFSVFFISRDMGKLRAWCKSVLSRGAVSHVKSAAEHSGGVGRKYLLSYLFLYFITFCETFVIMTILNVPYPLTIGLITAVADVLPVLGPGFVFLPLVVYQLLIGKYATALGMLIGWGILTLIRQILEPKLISSSIKVHPLVMLAAIYFSLVGKSFWILFYVMGLFTLCSVFQKTGALPTLAGSEKEQEKEPSAKEAP